MSSKRHLRRSKRITISVSPQVSELIDQMLAMGLFGLSRAAIAERLVCEGILKRLESGIIKQQSKKTQK
jgi:hypothetical protein